MSRRREKRHAVRKMRVDPSKPPCRGRFQTAISCYGLRAAVVYVMVKRRDIAITSCGDERDECKRTAEDASKAVRLLIPMKVDSDSDLIPATRSDGIPAAIGAKRRWRYYRAGSGRHRSTGIHLGLHLWFCPSLK